MVSRKQETGKKKFYKIPGKRPEKLSRFVKPMLAREADEPFDDKNWIYEVKWDGYRAIAEIKNGDVKLYSRNGISFNQKYLPVVDALEKMKHDMVLDGEVVVLDENGKSNFQKLQHYEENTQFPLQYYVFDILALNGTDCKSLPLIQRKELLKKALKKTGIVQYSDHVIAKGKDFFEAAKKLDLEGIMAKRSDSEYLTGVRTSDWLKIKQHHSDEAIIVGFTEPTGSRSHFGALVLATTINGQLKYAGHTGTGFNDKMLKKVWQKLQPLIQKDSPFAERVKTNMPVTWVKPKYIAEIKFTEWTTDGKMRHPVFLRMREDKNVKDITMNRLVKKTSSKAPGTKSKKAPTATVTKKASSNGKVERLDEEVNIGRQKVKLTNLNKIYWPDDKITKGMMIEYYQSVADYILPYLKDRPESLKRNPNGINDFGFFHKDAGDEAPSFVKHIEIYSESAKKDIDYLICNDKATLAYINNLGCIELNPWSSTTKKLDYPDYMIIDIDPSEKNTFAQVIDVANAYKELLDKAGARAYCKTSGATGLHVFVPMGKKYDYVQVKDFAALLSMMVNEMLPKFTSMERNLAKRGNKNIYLDHLQNRRGQTIACAYSLRPKPGATVSTPLLWKEVKQGLDPAAFDIHNTVARLKKMGDIFTPVLGKGVDLKSCLKKLGG